MAWTVEPDPLKPERALRWFARRLALPEEEVRALSQEARRRASWVSGLAALDMVQEVMDALEEALAQGTTFREFQKALSERVRNAWGEGSRHRLETVFRTNLQLAYGAGRYGEAERVRDLRPYWGLSVVLDGRTSRICAPLAGIVLPADHPFWASHIPPLHFGCRTALVTYSREEGERLAWKEAPAHAPQEGFGRPPGREEWSPHPRDYHPELWRAYLRALGRGMPEADRYLADLLTTRKPRPTDWMLAAGRVAVAVFPSYLTKVRPRDREYAGGQKRALSRQVHLAKRIAEGQLAPHVTEEAYEEMARLGATDPEVAVVLYQREKGPVVAVLARTEWAVPEGARGKGAGPIWFVVYSLRSGVLVTAYPASFLEAIAIPEDAIWLRKPSWLKTL